MAASCKANRISRPPIAGNSSHLHVWEPHLHELHPHSVSDNHDAYILSAFILQPAAQLLGKGRVGQTLLVGTFMHELSARL